MSENALSPTTETGGLQMPFLLVTKVLTCREAQEKAGPGPCALLTVPRRDGYLSIHALGLSRPLLSCCAAEKVKHRATKSCKQPLPLETGIYWKTEGPIASRALFSHIREGIKQIHSAILTDFL